MDSKDRFRRDEIMHLRRFDHRLTEFRRVYESLTADERDETRAWLESVKALEQKCPFSWSLTVNVEHDEFDQNGDKIDECNAHLSAWTMLSAIKCWDDDQPYVPILAIP